MTRRLGQKSWKTGEVSLSYIMTDTKANLNDGEEGYLGKSGVPFFQIEGKPEGDDDDIRVGWMKPLIVNFVFPTFSGVHFLETVIRKTVSSLSCLVAYVFVSVGLGPSTTAATTTDIPHHHNRYQQPQQSHCQILAVVKTATIKMTRKNLKMARLAFLWREVGGGGRIYLLDEREGV